MNSDVFDALLPLKVPQSGRTGWSFIVRTRSRTRTEPSHASPAAPDFLKRTQLELDNSNQATIQVAGHSMTPTIIDGEAILIERTALDGIRVGDIVLYASLSDTAVIHRVVRLDENPYGPVLVTRGDACVIDDVPVAADRLIARVISVERAGSPVILRQPELSRWQRLTRWCRRILSQ